MLICMNGYYTYYCMSISGGVLCWPVGWMAKCHVKTCLELQDNAASNTTFVGVANMLTRLIIVVKHMLICLVFYNTS